MKLKSMPVETLSQLLMYLAESARFSSLEKLEGGVTPELARAALRELAVELMRDATSSLTAEEIKKNAGLSLKTRKLLSYLSPHEEKVLLKAFGVTENK